MILRPSRIVAQRVRGLQDRLANVAPGQYLYPSSDLHFTVLSVYPASEKYVGTGEILRSCEKAVARAVADASPIELDLCGVISSDDSIMVKGYPVTDGLENLRYSIRHQIKATPFGAVLDSRYSIRSAHMTILRYRKPVADMAALASIVARLDNVPLGRFNTGAAELVENDWYMRAAAVNLVRTFQLGKPADTSLP